MSAYSQFFPSKPTFTEANLPPQTDKVFLITGGTGGIGAELAQILCHAGGTVYILGRNETKANATIERIEAAKPKVTTITPGRVTFVHCDCADLRSVKVAADNFLSQTSRLDVLFLNAGVSQAPAEAKSAQGTDLTMTTNVLSSFLLAQLLLPRLESTAAEATSAGTIRVVWTSSQGIELALPKTITVPESLADPNTASFPGRIETYTVSKWANFVLAAEMQHRMRGKNVMSLAVNPGNTKTELFRTHPMWMRIATAPLMYPAKHGAYSELYAGLSEELTLEENGKDGACYYVIPWGKVHQSMNAALLDTVKDAESGGEGNGPKLWDWCVEQTKEFAE